MNRLFLFPMLFALTGLVFALTLGLSPDTAHSAAPDDDDDDEWEELTKAQLNWRHGPKNNHLGVRLPAFEYAKMIEPELGIPPVVDLAAGVEVPIFVDGKKYIGEFPRLTNHGPIEAGRLPSVFSFSHEVVSARGSMQS